MLMAFTVQCDKLYLADAKRISNKLLLKEKYNPVRYTLATRRGLHQKPNIIYSSWKMKVRQVFEAEFGFSIYDAFIKNERYAVYVKMWFKDDRRADTDNVVKGIRDSLFPKPDIDDHNVSGAEEFYFDKLNPRVEVVVIGLSTNRDEDKKLMAACYDWLLEEQMKFEDILSNKT